MPYDPFALVPVGQTGLCVTRLGFGGTSIGGLYQEVTDKDAVAVVRHAWDLGIRYFDVAPLYGYGNAERRIGLGLRDRPRDEFVLSTKVGRLAVQRDAIRRDADIDRQLLDGREDAYYHATPPVRMVFDYSYDGVMRSVEESLTPDRSGTHRHPLHPRPRRSLGSGHQWCVPRPRGAAQPGCRESHRRGHEPGGDAGPLRARGRL